MDSVAAATGVTCQRDLGGGTRPPGSGGGRTDIKEDRVPGHQKDTKLPGRRTAHGDRAHILGTGSQRLCGGGQLFGNHTMREFMEEALLSGVVATFDTRMGAAACVILAAFGTPMCCRQSDQMPYQ
ncbi:hypothetical protein NHX12_024872 [Muraenolepis orangiensis]|uniref:Uncharacterized protein n=1 Tax=Muraenolepis orangiensis TaxID=630683 RepID=A0A9Q0EJ04_9TELE|nr:hypothetical protein NHX12_024872 [Muraenolepis orangiensis]